MGARPGTGLGQAHVTLGELSPLAEHPGLISGRTCLSTVGAACRFGAPRSVPCSSKLGALIELTNLDDGASVPPSRLPASVPARSILLRTSLRAAKVLRESLLHRQAAPTWAETFS